MGGVSSVCRVHSTLPILKIAKTAERVGGDHLARRLVVVVKLLTNSIGLPYNPVMLY